MDINKYVETICANARESSTEISCINQDVKNSILNNLIIEIEKSRISIKEENSKDIDILKKDKNFAKSFIDRLLLDDTRIDAMIESIKEIIGGIKQ